MIRINLLAAERPTQKKKTPAAAPGALQAYLFLVLFAGGAAVLCAAAWWFKEASLKELDTKTADAQKRLSELQAIKAKVDEYERQKRTLDAKINLIEQLQAQQSGPVHLLDETSRALPDFVWLTSLDQTGGQVRFKGESNGLSAVADFIQNLQHSGAPACGEPTPANGPADRTPCYFPHVELQSSADQNNVINFEVSADYQNAYKKIRAGTAPAAPGGAAAAPAAPAAGAAKPPAAPPAAPQKP